MVWVRQDVQRGVLAFALRSMNRNRQGKSNRHIDKPDSVLLYYDYTTIPEV